MNVRQEGRAWEMTHNPLLLFYDSSLLQPLRKILEVFPEPRLRALLVYFRLLRDSAEEVSPEDEEEEEEEMEEEGEEEAGEETKGESAKASDRKKDDTAPLDGQSFKGGVAQLLHSGEFSDLLLRVEVSRG